MQLAHEYTDNDNIMYNQRNSRCQLQLLHIESINFTLFSCGVNRMVNVDAMPGASFLLASIGLITLK